MCECFCGGRLKLCLLSVQSCRCECSSLGCCGYGYLGIWLCWLFGGYDCVGGLDDVAFFGDVHGLAFLWVKVHEPV